MSTYVYAVCHGHMELPSGVDGLGGNLRKVVHEELAAIASDVPPGRLRPSRSNVLAHSAVLHSLVGGPVLPMRFGQVFPDDETVKDELLGSAREHFSALLRRVEGRVQLNVRLAYDEDALLMRAVNGLATPLHAGASIEESVRIGELAVRAVDLTCAADGAHVLDRVGALASEVDVTSEGNHREPFRAAFLVSDRAAFEEALQSAAGTLPEGVTVECSGELLPFAFVGAERRS